MLPIAAVAKRVDPPAGAAENSSPACVSKVALGAGMLSSQTWAAIGRRLGLSGRELQIARCVFDDQTEYAIAVNLGVSRRTVHTHFERMYKKVGVTGRVTLVLRILAALIALTTSPGSGLPPLCSDHAAGQCPLRRRSWQSRPKPPSGLSAQ